MLNGGLEGKTEENLNLNESSVLEVEIVISCATDVSLMYIPGESKRTHRLLAQLQLLMSRECRTGIFVSNE